MNARFTLTDLLDLEPVHDDAMTYLGRSPVDLHATARVFGGQVAAQALRAAQLTVDPDRRVHSLHAYFLRQGRPSVPLRYGVEALRDGASYSTRIVSAAQEGEQVFHLTASFQRRRAGVSHQLQVARAPAPESLPTLAERFRDADATSQAWYENFVSLFPLEIRFVGTPPRIAVTRGDDVPARTLSWIRTREELTEPGLHACATAYMSDLFLLTSALLPYGQFVGDKGVFVASLDHAMWFHADFRADDWLLYDQEGFRAEDGRALSRGYLFDRQGTLVATVMQEGVIRIGSM